MKPSFVSVATFSQISKSFVFGSTRRSDHQLNNKRIRPELKLGESVQQLLVVVARTRNVADATKTWNNNVRVPFLSQTPPQSLLKIL